MIWWLHEKLIWFILFDHEGIWWSVLSYRFMFQLLQDQDYAAGSFLVVASSFLVAASLFQSLQDRDRCCRCALRCCMFILVTTGSFHSGFRIPSLSRCCKINLLRFEVESKGSSRKLLWALRFSYDINDSVILRCRFPPRGLGGLNFTCYFKHKQFLNSYTIVPFSSVFYFENQDIFYILWYSNTKDNENYVYVEIMLKFYVNLCLHMI